MRKAKIIFFTLLLLLVIFIAYPKKDFASSSPFSVDYNILYTITKGGNAEVSYNINITNLTQSEYASSYSLSLTNTDASNITDTSNLGYSLPYTVSKNSNSTTITTNFPQAQFGYGTGENWTISFRTSQISKIQGDLLNIAIPGFQNKSLIQSVNTQVVVPKSFGKINFVSPVNPQVIYGNNNTTIKFNSAQSYTTQGILIIMGNYQIFNFKFQYKLANYNPIFHQSFQIVIPADFKTQNVIFTKISPTPQKTFIDRDGNYIVEYILNPHQSITAKIDGEGQVFPTYNALSSPSTTRKYLSKYEYYIYTRAQPYWQVTNPFIHNLALKITKGDTTNFSKALSIENYVASHLTYNQKAIFDSNRQRLGAINALEDPTNAICQEYVDVFVALSRSVGVPSRMIAGYGDPPNINVNPLPPDILHAWAEFYSSRYGWVNVDPTWQSTSGNLDFFGNVGSSHFALARYGFSSVNPPLILSFVKEKNPQNNINIQAVNEPFSENPNFVIKGQDIYNLISGFTNNIDLYIKNTGNQVLRSGNISILSSNNKVLFKSNLKNVAIFPGTSEEIQIPIKSKNIFSSYQKEIHIDAVFANYSSKSVSKNIQTVISFKPFFISGIIPWIIISILFIISIIIADLFFRLKNKLKKH